MINRFLIGLVLMPSSIYAKMGVNVNHLRAILQVKLMMDDRRPNTFEQIKQDSKKRALNFATIVKMVVMSLFGLLFIFPFFITSNTTTQFTLYFSMFIFFLAATLISDFTSVLIDVRDNQIILPKPISDKTFLLSRLLHIIIHISKLVIPLNFAGIITIGITKGIAAAFLFFGILPFAVVFTIFLINALYLVILKVTTPEKFKSAITYFQIIFAVLIYGSYQIIPRMIDETTIENFAIPENGWMIAAPPYWFAAAWSSLYHLKGSWYQIAATSLSFTMPVFSVWLIIKYFAPSFNRKLAMISGSDQAEHKTATSIDASKLPKTSLMEKLSSVFTKSGAERMGFEFTWMMTGRSRDFKIKTYPFFGYLAVYLVMFFIKKKNFSLDSIRNDENSAKILLLIAIYMIGMLLMQAITNVRVSDKYKAAWIFFTTPIKQPGNVISGATKALIFKFYLPFALAVSFALIPFLGWTILPNIILGLCNQLCIAFLMVYITVRDLPFANADIGTAKGSKFAKSMLMLLLPFGMAGIHYLIYSFTAVVFILAILAVIAVWLIASSVYNRGWEMIKTSYE
jgi:hypothetical protein